MRARLLPALLAVVSLPACVTNSSFINTWNLPGAQPIQSATGKMAVVFMSPNGERRRAVEDQMVHQLGEHEYGLSPPSRFSLRTRPAARENAATLSGRRYRHGDDDSRPGPEGSPQPRSAAV